VIREFSKINDALLRRTPTVSGIQTAHLGNVRVVRAFDPVEDRMLMRADLYYREAQL
jgi:hypothetical protein